MGDEVDARGAGDRQDTPAATHPEAVAHARATFHALRERPTTDVVGRDATCDRLALLCTQRVLGLSLTPVRAVLIGDSGAEKTTMLRQVCEAVCATME